MLEIWQAELDWMDANVDGGILTVTMHPQVIGRGSRIAVLGAFVEHCREQDARFARQADVVAALSV